MLSFSGLLASGTTSLVAGGMGGDTQVGEGADLGNFDWVSAAGVEIWSSRVKGGGAPKFLPQSTSQHVVVDMIQEEWKSGDTAAFSRGVAGAVPSAALS